MQNELLYRHPSKIVDFIRFFLNFEKVVNGLMRPKQIEFFEMLEKHKRICALWCRQTGKSTTTAAGALAMALMNDNFRILIVAPSQRQSYETFEKMKDFIGNNEMILSFCTKFTATEIKFKNGSRILCVPLGPEGVTIRGFTADMLVLEESGFMKDSIVREVLMPMVASTNGIIIKIGTPKGKNHFYESCYGQNSNYKLLHYGCDEALKDGAYSKEFIEEMRRECSDLEFRTEYEAQFIEDADCYFPQELIQACIDENIELMDINNMKRHPKSRYVLGVDFARLGQDSTVFIILEKKFDSDNYVVCFIHELKHKLLNEAGGHIVYLDKVFDFEKIYFDNTGLGSGVGDYIAENIGAWKLEPITFTIQSKEDIYSNLKVLMGKSDPNDRTKSIIRLPNHKKLFYQLSDLRYELTSSGRFKIHHPDGGHDDYCDALALACWHYRPIGGKPLFIIQ